MWPGRYAKKKHPLISLFVISASIERFFALIHRYIWGTPTSLGPVQLCLQYWATFHRQRTQQRALQSRGESTDCKAEEPDFPSLRTPGAAPLLKVSCLCCREGTVSFFCVVQQTLGPLWFGNLIKYSFINPKHPPAPMSYIDVRWQSTRRTRVVLGNVGKAISMHCPWFTPWFFPSARRIGTASWWNSCENHKELNKSKMD